MGRKIKYAFRYALEYRKCSNKYCKTCKNGGKHGPYYYLYRRHNDKCYGLCAGKEEPDNWAMHEERLMRRIEQADLILATIQR